MIAAMPTEWSIRTRERLKHIPVLPLDELRTLPGPQEFDSGVYFLWAGDELMYIGKSRELLGRHVYQMQVNRNHPFNQSTTAKYIPHDRMTCLVIESGMICQPGLDGRLLNLERVYIATYEPPYNLGYINGFT